MKTTRRKANSADRLKKTALPCYAEPEQAEALRALSVRTRVPQQVYLREGIDLVLAKYGQESGK